MKSKLDDSKLEKFANELNNIRLTRKEISEKYDLNASRFPVYIKKAISKGFLDKKIYDIWLDARLTRVDSSLLKKYGPNFRVKLAEIGAEARLSKGPADTVSAAKLGGKATIKKHIHVQENLKLAVPYGRGQCSYGNTVFDSKGERLVGLVLHEYGLIDIDSDVNIQKNIGNKRVDFYINDKLVVEYHPFPKAHSEILEESAKEYLARRKKDFEPYFDGKIVLLSSPSAYKFFEKMTDLGITDTYKGVVEKFRKVKEDLKRHDEFMKDDYEMDKPLEEDVF